MTDEHRRKHIDVDELVTVEQQTMQLLQESGVLEELKTLDEKLSKSTNRRHELSLNPKHSMAILAWGNDFQIESHPASGIGGSDYSCICVVTRFDAKAIIVAGKMEEILFESQWKDRQKVQEVLQNAFSNPRTKSPLSASLIGSSF